jgi:CubicO group peptidase (beta-lactamase class C family)
MSVADLLHFARVHMADGACGDGKQLISADAARRMRSDPIAIPPFGARGVTHWGIGWLMCVGHGYTMVGHDGGTLGQYTYLRTFPELGVAFALFTNAPSLKLYSAVEAELMRALVGKAIPAEPPAKDFTLDANRYAGRYSNIASLYTIAMKDGQLSLHGSSPTGLIPEMRATLEPYCEDVFTLRAAGMVFDGQKISFLEKEADGRARYLRSGSRMARRG